VFALVSPLFFQVVIDKVLVHRGLTTLDVLMVGLVAVSVFEAVLVGLRTYVFSHTTNRIDVELGARLFRHLMALPLAYFESRRAGDSVAYAALPWTSTAGPSICGRAWRSRPRSTPAPEG